MNRNGLGTALYGSLKIMYRIFQRMPLLTILWLGIPLGLGTLLVQGYAAQKHLIDLFMEDISHIEGGWGSVVRQAGPFVGIITAIAVLRVMLTALQSIIDIRLRDKATLCLQSEVHRQAAAVPLERLDQPEYYDRLRRAESMAGTDLIGILQNVITTVRLICELGGLLTVSWLANPIVAVLLAVVFILSLSIRTESDFVKRRLNRDLTRSGREADYLSGTITKPATVRDMRISGSMSFLLAKWSEVTRHSLGLRMNANRREIRRGMIVSAIQITGLFGAVAWMVLQLKSGRFTAGTLVILFQAIRQIYGISGRLAFPIGKVYIQSAKIVDLVEFLQDELLMGNEIMSNRRLPTREKPGRAGKLIFEDVSYQYPGREKPVLQDIRLILNPGETVALVGENGAGKSTLVKMLLGLYTPTSGRITWNGVDLADIDPAHLRQSMSAVFQDFVRYETTLRDNICFGLPEEAVTDNRVQETLRDSGADGVERLLGGLDARVGQLVEGGRELSGGQWQRLAIGRAALRDAQLLVLDEPTSALDPQHEKEIYESFRRLGRGRTVLFISHRLGWARHADRIVVLRCGKIVEDGTHDSLLAAGGEYASMFRAQAAWYT